MKLAIQAIVIAALLSMGYAEEHPADEAAAKLEVAEKNFAVVKKRLDSAVLKITEPTKKKEATEAIQQMENDWVKIVENLTKFRTAGSPAPDTSTSSSLIPYYTAAEILDFQTQMYSDLAEWIETNWKE